MVLKARGSGYPAVSEITVGAIMQAKGGSKPGPLPKGKYDG